MNPYGDGSDGALNVTGTTSLPLNTKLQYTTVNVASGATLTTASTMGAVLYICATESITINGTINVSNKVNHGNNAWSTTIDGVTYTSPGVANGGAGGFGSSSSIAGGIQVAGFGGGGDGGGSGGKGGNGSPSSPVGGSSTSITRTTTGVSYGTVRNGSNGGGGNGMANVWLSINSGSPPTVTATGASGASGWGSAGSNGTGSMTLPPPPYNFSYGYIGAGGGGSGGRAGRAGVHVILKAPTITINGTVITSGTSGTNGGRGGNSDAYGGFVIGGYGGGGGGGGSAGNLSVFYGTSLVDNKTFTASGGSGGLGGRQGNNGDGSFDDNYAEDGYSGSTGSFTATVLAPIANFTANSTSGQRPLSVSFTNQSQGATSYSWNFGDSSGSSQTNPTHIYSAPGTYTVSLAATNGADSDTMTKTSYITVTVANYERSISGTLNFYGNVNSRLIANRSISGTLLFGGGARAVILRDAEGLQNKRYLYKVYDPDGNYIEVWKDVISDLTFTHEINTIGSSATIELARNSDTVGVSVEPLLTEAGQNLLTEDGLTILGSIESKNQIGSGSSVDYNNRVDVTVFYGGVEPLYTEDMESILTEDDEELLADMGAPNGRRIFTGFISEINSRYGDTDTTIVQLTSYGWDLDQYPITTSDGKTTVPFLSKDPSQIAKDAVDKFMADSSAYGTYTTRDSLSIDNTGTVVSYTFRANTYKDVLEKTLELMPSNWYFRVGLGDNLVYYKQRRATPHHLFYLGKHIKSLDLKGSIINSTNRVLFTGGGEPNLYIDRSEMPADRTRRTLKMMSDNRVTVLDSAEIIADGAIDGSNKRLFRTTVEILTKQYDIESISVGETVGFRNFGSEVDTFTMQILGLTYTPDSVQLQLETKPPTVSKRLQDISRNLLVNENQNIPDTPTT